MRETFYALCTAIALSFIISTRNKTSERLRLLPSDKERVLIVGCSSGVGRDIALQYASRGAKLMLFARREALLESLSQECRQAGSDHVEYIPGDVCQTSDLERLVESTKCTLGGLDTVIFCAGLISVRPFLDASGIKIVSSSSSSSSSFRCQHEESSTSSVDDALEHITNVNYMAAVRLCRLILPVIIETSVAPNIIVMSSLAGKVGAPTRALYAASKHALHGFFDSLRVEVERYNVHIAMVCPGTIDTELRKTAVDIGKNEGGPVAGSTKGKLSPSAVAQRTINASDRREREVYIPALFGYLAIWAKLIASRWVDWAAKKKYIVLAQQGNNAPPAPQLSTTVTPEHTSATTLPATTTPTIPADAGGSSGHGQHGLSTSTTTTSVLTHFSMPSRIASSSIQSSFHPTPSAPYPDDTVGKYGPLHVSSANDDANLLYQGLIAFTLIVSSTVLLVLKL
ncbi:hypothetical protein BDA99DRAFT_595052 [Phascolomyces articulosus]|uniref:Uncharacterized protein n=1 Tax=Phascolomyces articulosus TaxID=60185 RepID=A0AAD5KHF7_9FUNG|nr:hypothetical protein BDA99DRAFT_595052 [Phascolomyces articulosus]